MGYGCPGPTPRPRMRLRMMARLGTMVVCLGLAMGLGGGCGWLLVRKMQRVVDDEVLGVGVLGGPLSGTLGMGTSVAVERF